MKNTYAMLSDDKKFDFVEEDFHVNGSPIVKVTNVGVCGTDMAWWKSGSQHKGIILGHEFSGVVTDPGISRLSVGDRVTGYTQNVKNEFCGHCERCRAGDFEHCTNREVKTWKGGEINHPGAYSQYTTWFPGSFYVLPETVSNEEGALVEPMTVSLHAVLLTGIRPGDKVLVLGGGIIGCGAAEWARYFGAETVAITEIVPEKIEIIKKFQCADHVIKADAQDLFEQYEEISNGGFDVVIDCCGVGPAVNGALAHAFKKDVRARKCFTSIALTKADFPISYNDVVLKEITWKGSKGHFPSEFAMVLRLIGANRLNVKKYITKRIAFKDIQAGFEELLKEQGTPGKAMIIVM